MGPVFHCSPNSLSVNSKQPHRSSASLAVGTIKCAAGALYDAADFTAAFWAGMVNPIIDLQPFLVEIRRIRISSKIEEAVAFSCSVVVQRHCASETNCASQYLSYRQTQFTNLLQFKTPRG